MNREQRSAAADPAALPTGWARALEAGPRARAFARYLAGRVDVLPLAAASRCPPPLAPPPAWDPETYPLPTAFPALGPRPPELIRHDDLGAAWRVRDFAGRAGVLLHQPAVDPAAALCELQAQIDAAPHWPLALLARDFLDHDLAPRQNLAALAATLDDLRLLAPALCQIPRVLAREGDFLLLEDLGGRRLEQLASDALPEALRRTVLLFFEIAFRSRHVAVSLEIDVLPRGELVLVGGLFLPTRLPAPARLGQHLWDYCRSVAAHQPDRACQALRALLHRPANTARDEQLLSQLRQAVPFRGDFWTLHGESLAEYTVLHSRICRELGLPLEQAPEGEALAGFFRGLYLLARQIESLSPPGQLGDPLADGLEALAWVATFGQYREMLTPEEFPARVLANVRHAVEWPQRLDTLLAPRPAPPPARASASRLSSRVVALVALLLAVSLLGPLLPRFEALWVGLFVVSAAALYRELG